MDQAFVNSILRICHLLQKHGVEYMLVGGSAVAFHGYYRQSTGKDGKPMLKSDIDLWFNPTLSNYYKLLNALDDLDINVTELRDEVANPKRTFLQLEFEEFELDLLPSIKGLTDFSTSFAQRIIITIKETEIPVISYMDLIHSKGTDPREKDLNDIIQLRLKHPDKDK